RMAAGLGATVVICDVNPARLERLSLDLPANVSGLLSDAVAIEEQLPLADLVIGAVLVPGARAPHLVSRAQLRLMRPGSVIVDVCIDQGGCFETSRPTSHAAPTYVEEGVVHYMVTNMPGAVPQTSTRALTGATLPYVLELAKLGVDGFLASAPGRAEALSIRAGRLFDSAVAATFPDLPTLHSGA
ncbi:MAG TPA: hypothetical protein VLC09_20190, partial [Polyangiaceae bacterium]|nr:hypothetical protein [Polyangiaceae bacterium]